MMVQLMMPGYDFSKSQILKLTCEVTQDVVFVLC